MSDSETIPALVGWINDSASTKYLGGCAMAYPPYVVQLKGGNE